MSSTYIIIIEIIMYVDDILTATEIRNKLIKFLGSFLDE